MGLPALKICLSANFHPGLDGYSPVDESNLFFFCESLTFMDPGIVFGAPVIFFIRSFMFINISFLGFGALLLLVGWFVISRFIQKILRDVALFITGEASPFFAQLLHIFWGCGAGSSLGSVVSICQTVSVSPCVHSIRMRRQHFDIQDFG